MLTRFYTLLKEKARETLELISDQTSLGNKYFRLDLNSAGSFESVSLKTASAQTLFGGFWF